MGYAEYLNRLHRPGFNSLDKHSDFYGDGLALGCGEVTLFEMVQAYGCLANQGVFLPLCVGDKGRIPQKSTRVFSEETSSLIGNILSDPEARNLEFGEGGLMNFPVQTVIKTGTSTDYRDSWAFGYNYRYAAGIWMGNFDAVPMNGVTGSTGPAILLRSVFVELNKKGETRPLYLSPKLVQKETFVHSGQNNGPCVKRFEWFIKGTLPRQKVAEPVVVRTGFLKPVNGLEMAMDPQIPEKDEAFEFERPVWVNRILLSGLWMGRTSQKRREARISGICERENIRLRPIFIKMADSSVTGFPLSLNDRCIGVMD